MEAKGVPLAYTPQLICVVTTILFSLITCPSCSYPCLFFTKLAEGCCLMRGASTYMKYINDTVSYFHLVSYQNITVPAVDI